MRRLFWLAAAGLIVASAAERPRVREMVRGVDVEASAECDPSYPTLCIPVGASDLDCADVGASSFPVRPPDPHGFDADHDGRGCEPWPRRRR